MNLSDYLNEAGIELHIAGDNKREVLANLVKTLTKVVPVDQSTVVNLLEEREKLSTTGIGCEVAIPHCKTAEVDDLQIVIAISRKGIDFKALDGRTVRLFFLLIAPERSNSEHLKALAKIARLAKDRATREALLQMETPQEIVRFIADEEACFGK